MGRTIITLPDELESALADYQRDHGDEPSLDRIAESALRDFLRARGYLKPRQPRPLRLTPADEGSCDDRGSIDHDQILARRTP